MSDAAPAGRRETAGSIEWSWRWLAAPPLPLAAWVVACYGLLDTTDSQHKVLGGVIMITWMLMAVRVSRMIQSLWRSQVEPAAALATLTQPLPSPLSAPPQGLPTALVPQETVSGGDQMDAFAAFGSGTPAQGPISTYGASLAAAASSGSALQFPAAEAETEAAAPLPMPPPMPMAPRLPGSVSFAPGALSGSHAPLSTGSPTRAIWARAVRESLEQCARASGSNPSWAQHFWLVVAAHEKEMEPGVLSLLKAMGYIGVNTATAPPVDEMKRGLLTLEADDTAGPGKGLPTLEPGQFDAPVADPSKWSASLPLDFRRAGTEIYRNLRHQGAGTVRDWINQQHTGSRSTTEWAGLWSMAVQVDYALAAAKDQEQLLHILGTSDLVEISLRHLAAHVYERRTRDVTGASEIRGITAPGSLTDIAPTWLVEHASSHSRAELKRDQLVEADAKRNDAKGSGKKGVGKGEAKGQTGK